MIARMRRALGDIRKTPNSHSYGFGGHFVLWLRF